VGGSTKIDFFASRHIEHDRRRPLLSDVGRKALGLYDFPLCWTPPFIVVGTSIHSIWMVASDQERRRLAARISADLKAKLDRVSPEFVRNPAGYILRSSSTGEDIGHRGDLESLSLPELEAGLLCSFFDRLLMCSPGEHGQIGVIAQTALATERLVHLSNERRLSKTQNEWVISQVITSGVFVPPEGCNSTRARALAEDLPLTLRRGELKRDLRATLRGVGRWANKKFSPRVHFEAVVADARLYLVQVDAEKDLGGVNPHEAPLLFRKGCADAARLFHPFVVGSPTPFQKLANISDFASQQYSPPHQLYFATAREIASALKSKSADLKSELEALTSDRLVIREDRHPDLSDVPGYNLYRSDTLNSSAALTTLKARVEYWRKLDIPLDKICFIIHAFVPALASAWAMYSAQEGRVRVHALWGLPDGLQFLTPDEYEFDLATKSWSSRVHFKEFFVREQSDGTWARQSVSLSIARHKVLSVGQLNSIASLTVGVAERLASDVHIMFFCGLPKEAGMGDVLPWYRAREVAAYEAKREKRRERVSVSSVEDLESIDVDRQVVIALEPDIQNYRDHDFIKAVAAYAVQHSIPVEIKGSPLAHAYYLLRHAGCTVFSSFAPAYERVRQKRQFGKLVRDHVVEKIGDGGERPVSFNLPSDDRAPAFFAKMIEEGLEVLRAQNDDERLEELADVYEVLRGWIEGAAFELAEVAVAADEKRQRLGGFDRGDVLVETGTGGADRASGSALTFEQITRPRQHRHGVSIPAGRLALIASGRKSLIEVPGSEAAFELSMNDDGELVLTQVSIPADGEGQLAFDL